MTARDNFTKKTIDLISKRAAYRCSNPDCKHFTIGPQKGGQGVINIGVAAHITAAAVGGPRYDTALTPEERRHHTNGIWCCQTCGKLVDSDEGHFTVETLRTWKADAEDRAFAGVATADNDHAEIDKLVIELDEGDRQLIQTLGLPSDDDIDTITVKLRSAAWIDVETFKAERRWPRHAVNLILSTEDAAGAHQLDVEGVAKGLSIVSELSVIAAPGTGKTTTLIQLTDAIAAEQEKTVPTMVPLAEWSARSDPLLLSLTHRNAFRQFREQHFMLLALHGRVVLLLDGWNELDSKSRERLIRELDALRRDFPLIRLVMSTRRQARDIPVAGAVVEIESLSEAQQLEIARALRGRDGEALLDQAWRTPGIRELISVPLYLNALLSYATAGKMPKTKEEVLRLFVETHENDRGRAEILDRELLGHHSEMLQALAVEAIVAANTTIQIAQAKSVIRSVEDQLVSDRQISNRPQPATVIDVLVNQHILIRSGGDGVSFQHQQFQEWHASFEVEQLMRSAVDNNNDGERLESDILNWPAWEESILFACERLSRAESKGLEAVAAAVLRTIAIDPLLAAEMIYRAPSVWDLIEHKIVAFARRWHKDGKVDGAVRFMVATGRPEFALYVWPLVSNSDRNLRFEALRAVRRFRAGVLGDHIRRELPALPDELREDIISEIATNSGIEGIELATQLAKSDPSPRVQSDVAESLIFRRADRYLSDLLQSASNDRTVSRPVRACAREAGNVNGSFLHLTFLQFGAAGSGLGGSIMVKLRGILHSFLDEGGNWKNVIHLRGVFLGGYERLNTATACLFTGWVRPPSSSARSSGRSSHCWPGGDRRAT